MITFNYENDFTLENENRYSNWISNILVSEGFFEGEINYIFCNDDYLLEINLEYLNHDTYTDIISFDYSDGNIINGDIFISTQRVFENAADFNVSFSDELLRVMSHGILHYCGYKDKTKDQSFLMRQKEEEKILLFHVEQ